jgi:sigma54-dependent transcription regulator
LKLTLNLNLRRSRAGATLVGPTGAGKSTCYRILSRIMTSLHKAGSKNEQYQEVAFEILNPKCITMGELYGPSRGVPLCARRLHQTRSGLVSDAATPSTES